MHLVFFIQGKMFCVLRGIEFASEFISLLYMTLGKKRLMSIVLPLPEKIVVPNVSIEKLIEIVSGDKNPFPETIMS